MNANPIMTRHAVVRQQQRCIPPLLIDWLMAYGSQEHAGGVSYRFFDKDSRKQLARDVGERIVQLLSPLLDCYLVESADGRVITVGHRYVRVRRG